MKTHEWNDRQKQAIDARGSVVVSAAAGSGKTSVLTERVLALIEEGEDIERMLIVTFTNLAASEMRERIYRRLSETGLVSPRLAAQAEKCVFADISTLHAFCGRLIRENFVYAGISPAFAIADESQTARLKQAAFEQTLDYAMQQTRYYPMVKKYADRGDTDNIQRIVFTIYARAVSLKDPQGWLDKALQNYKGGDFISILFDEYSCMVREAAVDALPYLQQRTAVWRERGFEAEACECERDSFLFCNQSESIKINSVCLPKAADISIKAKGAPNLESKKLTNYANRIFNELRRYEGNFCEKVRNELNMTAQDGRFFIELTQVFMERYAKLKLAKNLLDHDDTMHLALRALSVSDVAAHYRERYAHVFVDEYQDINGVQHEIISRLQRGGNDFLVGDVKQCIYTFRESNPDLLMLRCRELKGNGLIEMNTNYRSAPPIIDFVNGVMRHMMSQDAGGIEYTGGQVLKAGIGGQGNVSIVLAGVDEEDKLEAEAAELAEQIKKLYDNGFAYKQIAVLRPEMSQSGKHIVAALSAAGIPVVNGFGAEESDYAELEVFKNLLKLIDKQEDDIALLSVMRYPYFAFTEPELAEIRLAQTQEPDDKSFCHALQSFKQNSRLGKKVQSFLYEIDRYKRLGECMKLPDFLFWLREEIKLKDYALTSPGGYGCDAAIGTFISAVSSQKPICLADVLSVADRICTKRETQQSPADADGVYLTTIHKSKGLEFRAVILSGLHKVIDQRDTKGAVLVGRDLGLALDILDEKLFLRIPTFHRMAVARSIAREKISETVRLLYVGMTRAIERLILLGAGTQIKESWLENKPDGWQHKAYKYFDLLMPAIQMMCRDSKTDLSDIIYVSQKSKEEEPSVNKEERLEAIFAKAKQVEPANIFTGYMYKEDIGVPSKVSVSSLKRLEEDKILIPVDITAQTDGLTAAQRGTATHRLLEYTGLEQKTQEEISALILELENKKIFETGTGAYINVKSVCSFLNSNLAQRARRAQKCLLEQPFCLKMQACECGLKPGSKEMVIVQGVIDLCFLEQNNWIIIDYKTDAVKPSDAQKAADKYELQLKLYSQALERITYLPVAEKYIYFLSADMAVRLG